MQKAYITALYELMQKDRQVCSLLSDSGTEYDEMMFREFPAQCFNFGIAEEHKVAAASGMAALGKIPFVYTTGAFLAYRSYEFIRDDVCLQNRNVKIIGMGSGLAWSTLGPSHHTTEDISALRAIPNLTLLCPATPLEVRACVRAAYAHKGPVYIRIGMSREEELYKDEFYFKIGKNVTLLEGAAITLFATGSIAAETLHAARQLTAEGISVSVVNVHSLKPMDTQSILQAAAHSQQIFTVEEHNVLGGLGGAVAEILAQVGAAVPLVRIGLNDCFASGYGTHAQVRQRNGLDRDGIYDTIKQNLVLEELK